MEHGVDGHGDDQTTNQRGDRDSPGELEEKQSGWPTHLRRGLAALIILAGAVAAAGSYWLSPLGVCHVVTGGQPLSAIEVCNPWGVSELVPFALVGLLLLTPDFTELSVANLLTLKREVNAQKKELDATVGRQAALERQFVTQVSNLQATQSSSNYIIIGGSAAHLPENVEQKARQFTPQVPHHLDLPRHGVEPTPSHPLDPQLAPLGMDLIAAWERLQPYVSYATGRDSKSLDLGPADGELVQRWYNVFREEIEIVKAARNNVAHAKPIQEQDLRGAVRAASELERLLGQGNPRGG